MTLSIILYKWISLLENVIVCFMEILQLLDYAGNILGITSTWH